MWEHRHDVRSTSSLSVNVQVDFPRAGTYPHAPLVRQASTALKHELATGRPSVTSPLPIGLLALMLNAISPGPGRITPSKPPDSHEVRSLPTSSPGGRMGQRLRRAAAYVAAHRKALSTSLLNQAVSSATNFVLGFILVRVLSTADYGTYGVGLSICYLYSGFGNALFHTQMVVHAPDKAPHDRLPYAARMLWIVASFCAITLFLAAIGLRVGGQLVSLFRGHLALGFAVAMASVGYLLKDFFIRQAYTARAETRALLITCAVAMALVGVLIAAKFFHVTLGVETALFIFAASQLVGAGTGLLLA